MKKIIIRVVEIILATVSTLVVSFIFAVCACMCAAHAYGDTVKHGNTLVINKTEKGTKTATVYTVKVNGKDYRVFKGPRGGYFYEVNGERKYLTKKQKEIMNIK